MSIKQEILDSGWHLEDKDYSPPEGVDLTKASEAVLQKLDSTSASLGIETIAPERVPAVIAKIVKAFDDKQYCFVSIRVGNQSEIEEAPEIFGVFPPEDIAKLREGREVNALLPYKEILGQASPKPNDSIHLAKIEYATDSKGVKRAYVKSAYTDETYENLVTQKRSEAQKRNEQNERRELSYLVASALKQVLESSGSYSQKALDRFYREDIQESYRRLGQHFNTYDMLGSYEMSVEEAEQYFFVIGAYKWLFDHAKGGKVKGYINTEGVRECVEFATGVVEMHSEWEKSVKQRVGQWAQNGLGPSIQGYSNSVEYSNPLAHVLRLEGVVGENRDYIGTRLPLSFSVEFFTDTKAQIMRFYKDVFTFDRKEVSRRYEEYDSVGVVSGISLRELQNLAWSGPLSNLKSTDLIITADPKTLQESVSGNALGLDWLVNQDAKLAELKFYWQGLSEELKRKIDKRQQDCIENEHKRSSTVERLKGLLEMYKTVLDDAQAVPLQSSNEGLLRIDDPEAYKATIFGHSVEGRVIVLNPTPLKVLNGAYFAEGGWGVEYDSGDRYAPGYQHKGSFRKIFIKGIGGVELENTQDTDYFSKADIITLMELVDELEKRVKELVPEGAVIIGETKEQAVRRLAYGAFSEPSSLPQIPGLSWKCGYTEAKAFWDPNNETLIPEMPEVEGVLAESNGYLYTHVLELSGPGINEDLPLAAVVLRRERKDAGYLGDLIGYPSEFDSPEYKAMDFFQQHPEVDPRMITAKWVKANEVID